MRTDEKFWQKQGTLLNHHQESWVEGCMRMHGPQLEARAETLPVALQVLYREMYQAYHRATSSARREWQDYLEGIEEKRMKTRSGLAREAAHALMRAWGYILFGRGDEYAETVSLPVAAALLDLIWQEMPQSNTMAVGMREEDWAACYASFLEVQFRDGVAEKILRRRPWSSLSETRREKFRQSMALLPADLLLQVYLPPWPEMESSPHDEAFISCGAQTEQEAGELAEPLRSLYQQCRTEQMRFGLASDLWWQRILDEICSGRWADLQAVKAEAQRYTYEGWIGRVIYPDLKRPIDFLEEYRALLEVCWRVERGGGLFSPPVPVETQQILYQKMAGTLALSYAREVLEWHPWESLTEQKQAEWSQLCRIIIYEPVMQEYILEALSASSLTPEQEALHSRLMAQSMSDWPEAVYVYVAEQSRKYGRCGEVTVDALATYIRDHWAEFQNEQR